MRLTSILAAASKLPGEYHNMPQRFIERHTTFIKRRTPRLPQYEQKIFKYKREAYYDKWRPWQDEFRNLNQQNAKTTKIFVEPIREWYFFRGDRVEVIHGPDKGKQGIVNYIVKERNWVFVQGINLSREWSNLGDDKLGNILCSENPLLINRDVKLVDPSDLMPTDIEWRVDEDGNKVRVSTRTERVIPTPAQAYETIDYVEKSGYIETPKDTSAKDAVKKTYVPVAKTFEMDICDQMGIKDDAIPYPMFWY